MTCLLTSFNRGVSIHMIDFFSFKSTLINLNCNSGLYRWNMWSIPQWTTAVWISTIFLVILQSLFQYDKLSFLTNITQWVSEWWKWTWSHHVHSTPHSKVNKVAVNKFYPYPGNRCVLIHMTTQKQNWEVVRHPDKGYHTRRLCLVTVATIPLTSPLGERINAIVWSLATSIEKIRKCNG